MAKKILKGSYEHKRASLRDTPFSRVALEKRFLGGLLRFPEAARTIVNQFNPEYFSSDKLKWMYEQVKTFFDKTGYIIDDKGFEEFIQTLKPKKRKIYKRLWKSCKKSGDNTSESSIFVIKDSLENLYHARLIVYNANMTVDLLERVGADGFEYVNKAKEQYASIQGDLISDRAEAILIDPIKGYDDYKKYHKRAQKNPTKFKGIPTGLKPLDKRIGGLRESEFALIATRTGIGKSILMMEFATHCFMHHGDVIYVTIEMPELQMRQRFYCHLSGIKYKFFRNFELTKKHWKRLDNKVQKRFDKHPYRMHIVDLPASGTVANIKNKIEELFNKHPIKLVCIDYLNIVKCASGGIATDWQNQIEVAIDMKQMTRYFNTRTWTAAQLSSKTEGKESKIQIKDMALAKHIPDHLDLGIYVQDTDTTDQDELFRMGFLKTRDFKADEFMLKADRDRMTFNTLSKKKLKEYKQEMTQGVEV